MKRKEPPAPALSPQEIHDHIVEWCRASCSLPASGLQTFFSVVEGLKSAQSQSIAQDVQDLGREPLLLQYSSDLTPAIVKRTTTTKAAGLSVRRKTQNTYEFIVQNLLFSWHTDRDTLHTHIFLTEPKPLLHGKSMAALCAVGAEVPLLRLGSSRDEGIRIFHQVYDRGLGQELMHGLAGFWQHGAGAGHSSTETSQADPSSSDLFHWAVWTPCAAHDAYNALKWCSFNVHGHAEVLKNVYVAVSAYRFCYSHCLDSMSSWLGSHLQGVSAESLPEPWIIADLWTHLGAGPDVVHILSWQIRLFWTGSTLQVQEGFLQNDDWLSILTATLMSIWSFQSFSSTRWLSVGRSCRGLLRGLMSGFMSMVAHLKSCKCVSSFYTAGTDKLGGAEWQFIAISSFAAYLPEAFVSAVLEDSRVARQLSELQVTIAEQFTNLSDVDGRVWGMISSQLGGVAQNLRSDILTATLVAWSFLEFRVLSRASQYPWKLCCGDISANLSALESGPKPRDSVTGKIWTLAQAGFNRQLLIKSISLLGQCVWSTHLAEKQHSGIAVVRRHHPELHASTLASRGYLHLTRQMLTGVSAEQRAVARWQKRWQRLQCSVPHRISGRHLFYQDVMQRARYAEEHGKRRKRAFDRSKIVRLHGEQWQALPDSQKQQYAVRAEYAKSAALQRQTQAIDAHLELGAELQQQLQESQDVDPAPNLLRAGDISTQMLAEVSRLVQGPLGSPSAVKNLRQTAESCPPPVPGPTLERWCSQSSLDIGADHMSLPVWARKICEQRDFFRTSIFMISTTGTAMYYRFLLFAILKPTFLMLLPLDHKVLRLKYGCTPGDWLSDLAKDFSQHWTWSAGEFARGDVLAQVGVESVRVFQHSFFDMAGYLQTLDISYPLSQVLAGLEADMEDPKSEEKSQAERSEKRARSFPESVYKQHPWARVADEAGVGSSGAAPLGSMHLLKAEPASTGSGVSGSENQLFEELVQELQAERTTLPELGPDMTQFKISLAGDARLVSKKGPKVHGVLASLRTGGAVDAFAVRMGMNRSARFECSVYSQEGATALAKGWCSRMGFLYDVWLRRDGDSWPFTEQALKEYKPPDELAEFMQAWSHRQCKRAREVMSLLPSQ